MADKIFLPKIETQEELHNQQSLLMKLKVIETTIKNTHPENNTVETLKNALIIQLNESFKRTKAIIDYAKNQGLLTVSSNESQTVQLTSKFPCFIEKLRRNITIAKNNEEIMFPIMFYGKKYSEEVKK